MRDCDIHHFSDRRNWRGLLRHLCHNRGRHPKGRFCWCMRGDYRRLNLPLEFQEVATESIGDLHAQLGELEESLPKFALAQEKKNGCERCGEGKQREHYEYELQGRHTPYVRAFVRLNGRTSRPSSLAHYLWLHTRK